LEIVRTEKEAARVTELAVQKFQAEVFNSQSREFDILQNIKQIENRINFLCGRFPQPIVRNVATFQNQLPKTIQAGIPSQLLANRPDIKQAELGLLTADLNVQIAKAEFYPSLGIKAGLGFQSFSPKYLLNPHSLMFGLAGDLASPIINRLAIKAEFKSAKAEQLMALYNYQKSILSGFVEVSNELSNIDNLAKLYAVKNKEVEVHIAAIGTTGELFKYARADYFEVLITQRDALDSRLHLIEVKQRQFNAVVNLYRALGGGWR
jgi:outer membrane protein TolC